MSSRSGFARSLPGWWAWVFLAGAVVTLAVLGGLPRWPGLVHAVALPPFDLAFDLRVLVARAPSYPWFALGALASIAVRALVLAAVLGSIGSGQPFRRRLRRAALFYAIAWIPLALAAAVAFAAVAALYHWYFWAALGLVAITGISLAGAPYAAGVRVGPVLAYVLALAAVGAAARATGPWGSVALVPLSAAITMFTVRRLSRSRQRRRMPRAVLVLAIIGMLSTAAHGSPLAGVSDSRARGEETGPILFLVPGVDTSSGYGAMFRLDPRALGFGCDRVFYYSYLGAGPGAPRGEARCPIRDHEPYGEGSTQLPLGRLSEAFSRQLAAVRERAGGAPIVVITHSQGNVIAWRALASRRVPGVSDLIMLAGFPQNPAAYPPRDTDGPGRVGGDALRVLAGLGRRMGFGTFDPDAPLAREILARPAGTRAVLAEPLPDEVEALLVSSTFDVPLFPHGRAVVGARDGGTVDATHVGLVSADRTAEIVRAFLRGQVGGGPTLLAAALDWITPAFGSPPYDA